MSLALRFRSGRQASSQREPENGFRRLIEPHVPDFRYSGTAEIMAFEEGQSIGSSRPRDVSGANCECWPSQRSVLDQQLGDRVSMHRVNDFTDHKDRSFGIRSTLSQ
jgi:hypothetical protein